MKSLIFAALALVLSGCCRDFKRPPVRPQHEHRCPKCGGWTISFHQELSFGRRCHCHKPVEPQPAPEAPTQVPQKGKP